MAPILPADYYLKNFRLIVRTVLEQDSSLFHVDEHVCLEQLLSLPEPALRLYIRLFNRRGVLFRTEKLAYPELGDLTLACSTLMDAGFCWQFVASSLPPLVLQPPEDPLTHVEQEGPDRLAGWGVERCLPPPLTQAPVIHLMTALELYTVPELQIIAKRLSVKASHRVELLTQLLKRTELGEGPPELSTQALVQACMAQGGLILLRHRPLLELVERLFFLNEMQDHTTMVTSDLAVIRYPKTALRRTRPVYASREELDGRRLAEWLQSRWYQALEREAFDEALALGRLAQQRFFEMPPGPQDFLARYGARHLYARLSLRALQEAERRLPREDAILTYRRLLDAGLPERYRGEAWVRLALLLERGGERIEALETCREALQEYSTRRGERISLEKRQHKLEKTLERKASVKRGRSPRDAQEEALEDSLPPPLEVTIHRPWLHSAPYSRALFAASDGRGLTVEALALEAFRAVGVAGLYTENLFFTTLAGVLFWDIYFADIPDVFLTPYQDAPLDLNTDEFYERRKDLIDARLEALRLDPLPWLRAHALAHAGTVARGVSWDTWPLATLEEAVSHLGGERLAFILGHLLEDFPRRRRGLPDLLLWRSAEPARPAEGAADGHADGAERDAAVFWGEEGFSPPDTVWLAEVKSPRDRLSPEQLAWISALQQGGIAFMVCKVADGGTLQTTGGG